MSRISLCLFFAAIALRGTLLSPYFSSARSTPLEKMHEFCVDQYQGQRAAHLGHRSEMAAIVCGAGIRGEIPSDIQQAWTLTGVFHLIVVSGAHLTLLALLLRIFGRAVSPLIPEFPGRSTAASSISVATLVLFMLVNRMDPPILRAGLQMAAAHFSWRFQLRWPTSICILISGWLCLGFVDSRACWLSLILSWNCAAVLAVLAGVVGQNSAESKSLSVQWLLRSLISSTAIWIVLIPWSLPLGLSHPISVIVNATLAPMAAVLLFPISLAAGFFPNICGPAADLSWNMTHAALLAIARSMKPESIGDAAPTVVSAHPSLALTLSCFLVLQLALFLRPLRRKPERNAETP